MAELSSKLDIWAYLLQQAPVIVVLGLVCFGLYKALKARDAEIRVKDTQLANERKELMELYGQAVQAQQRGNDIQLQLIAVIKELQFDLDKLRDLVHDKLN